MAVSTSKMRLNTPSLSTVCVIILIYSIQATSTFNTTTHNHNDVEGIVENSCFLAGVEPMDLELRVVLEQLAGVYPAEERVVVIGIIPPEDLTWPGNANLRVNKDSIGGKPLLLKDIGGDIGLLLFKKVVKDRTCLVQPSPNGLGPIAKIPPKPWTVSNLLMFINAYCHGFRDANGALNIAGLHRKDILNNLFSVKSIGNTTITMWELFHSKSKTIPDTFNFKDPPFAEEALFQSNYFDMCIKPGFSGGVSCNKLEVFFQEGSKSSTPRKENSPDGKRPNSPNKISEIPTCDILNSPPSKSVFFHEYLKKSRPFIVRNMTSSWPAFKKWTNDFLRGEYGKNNVHVKLTPSGDYEGVENASLWETYATFTIPEHVKTQLKFPDLVTVRPAGINMNFSSFMDLIEKAAREGVEERTLSAYLEYSSIPDYMPGLEEDINEPDFMTNLLKRSHLNMWLSDGHTLGRLHFDQYDNILCQLSGTKQLMLFDPHDNRRLYEAHIPQATLSYNRQTHKFRRYKLEDSTSMVMAPIDLANPDFERFPLFRDARPLLCTIHEGDALFMPSFWWHEVQSFPSETVPRNLAVNFWYEPFLKREFPCQECILDVNPEYLQLLTAQIL